MNWKPEETDIIDYLYGSMTPEIKEKFETYLSTHPELQKELNDLRQTQNILPSFQDAEVIPPVPIPGTQANRLQRSRKWLYPVSIAASVAIILVTGYLTNFRMSFNDNGFDIGFAAPETGQDYLTVEDVDQLIAGRMASYERGVDKRLTEISTDFSNQLVANKESTEQRLNSLASSSTAAQLDEAQVLQFMSQLQDENGKMMQNFFQVNAKEQSTYLRNILLEYSEYIDKQRQEDIQFFQASLRDIRSDSELKQEATDKILANIISTVNNQSIPINDRQSLD